MALEPQFGPWQPPEDGAYYGLPDAQYRLANGISNSMLGHFAQSPAHLVAHIENPEAPTPAQVIGRIAHSLILEPNTKPYWVVRPKGVDGRTKDGKAWIAEQTLEIIKEDDFTEIKRMVKSVRAHPAASDALAVGNAEVSCWASCLTENGPVLRKGRMDFVNDGPAIIDAKSTECASYSAFAKSIQHWNYHRQAAYYLDIWNDLNPNNQKEHFIFIAFEKTPPYAVNVFDLDHEAILLGRRQYKAMLEKYAKCVKEDSWPAYGTGITRIDLPAWAYRE